MTNAIEEIRDKVQHILRRRGVLHAAVFGSVARGEETDGSDIDFLVELEKGRTLTDLAGLRLDLAELLGRDVDVVTPSALHPRLKDQILGELVPIL
jgi:predicted nucleotidyltransferase